MNISPSQKKIKKVMGETLTTNLSPRQCQPVHCFKKQCYTDVVVFDYKNNRNFPQCGRLLFTHLQVTSGKYVFDYNLGIVLQMRFFKLGTGSDWQYCTAFGRQPGSQPLPSRYCSCSGLSFAVSFSLSKQTSLEDHHHFHDSS